MIITFLTACLSVELAQQEIGYGFCYEDAFADEVVHHDYDNVGG